MQKKILCMSFVLLGLPLVVQAQTLEWKANAYTFFDNHEFQGTSYDVSKTMAGVRLSPEVGIGWNNCYKLMAGVHAQKNFGTKKFVDDVHLTAYFQFDKQTPRLRNTFLMGAFPRQGLLDNYSNLFLRDSISYYRPNLNGIFWQLTGRNNFLNVWLDWTGWQSPTERETFFVGFSGEQRASWFVANMQAYMFHYANTHPRSGDSCVHDNVQAQLSAGADFTPYGWRHVEKMRFTAGLLAGMERKRDDITPTEYPLGLVLDLQAQIWHIGTRTIYYYGDARQTVPTDNHSANYWGNPLLQANSYLQSYWYYSMFDNGCVSAQIGYTFHLVGKELYSQQALQLAVNLDRNCWKPRSHRQRRPLKP